MSEEFVEKIEKISSEEAPGQQTVQPEVQKGSPDRERFDALMQQEKAAPQETTAVLSPMDTIRDLNTGSGKNGKLLSYDSLVAQTKATVSQIEEVKKVLASPQMSIRGSTQQLLNNKLSHIDESLRIALSKAGLEYNPETSPIATTQKVNPIQRFIGFLTDGQNQLDNLGSELQVMGLEKKELSPVDMLAIQVKVTQVQQELELFTSLLNKGLESIKTMMNIQV